MADFCQKKPLEAKQAISHGGKLFDIHKPCRHLVAAVERHCAYHSVPRHAPPQTLSVLCRSGPTAKAAEETDRHNQNGELLDVSKKAIVIT